MDQSPCVLTYFQPYSTTFSTDGQTVNVVYKHVSQQHMVIVTMGESAISRPALAEAVNTAIHTMQAIYGSIVEVLVLILM